MKKLYLQLHGIKRTGFLLSKYVLENGTLLRGAVIVVNGKQLISVVHANDGGWVDGNGKVRWFELDENRFFVGQLAFMFNVFKPRNKKLQKNGGINNG